MIFFLIIFASQITFGQHAFKHYKNKSAEYLLGEVPSSLQFFYNTSRLELKSINHVNIPEQYDLRKINNSQFLTSVKDQGQEGACWAFAVYGSIESYWLKCGKNAFDFSEQHLATCNGLSLPDEGGNCFMATAYLSGCRGAISEEDDPYTLPKNPECLNNLNPVGFITEARYLPGKHEKQMASSQFPNTEDDIFNAALIKHSLMEHGALYVNLYWEDRYFDNDSNFYCYQGNSTPNHAVTLIGWDDNKQAINSSGQTCRGAWIAKNSWGENWGEKGFFYIAYDDSQALSTVAYFPSAIADTKNKIVLQYDELGYQDLFGFNDLFSIGENSEEAYGLVKFQTDTSLILNSIGIPVTVTGESIEVEVYNKFDGHTLSGLMRKLPKQTFELPGYYNINFDDKLHIAAHSDFYIKVKYTTPGLKEPIAVEKSSFANIENDKCWVSSSKGKNWIAVGNNTKYKFDLCIKVYTSINTTPVGVASISSSQPPEAIIDFNVFPNPTSGEINVNGIDLDGCTVKLYNSVGSLLYSEQINTNYWKFNLNCFNSQLYILKIEINNRCIGFQKVVICK